MKWSILLLVLSLNSACGVREANLRTFDDQRRTTLSERTSILAHIKSSFLDPYTIRDAEISQAAPSMMLNGEMTLNICIAANAKNSYGAYAGKQTTLYYLTTSGRVLDTNKDAFAELFCASQRLRYEPFLEVEQLGRASRVQ